MNFSPHPFQCKETKVENKKVKNNRKQAQTAEREKSDKHRERR